MAWKGIVGKSFTQSEFDAYCHTLVFPSWKPGFCVIHNTAIPTLAQRPKGFTLQHMKNFEVFYRDTQHWSSGPNIFVDDLRIWVFTPLTMSGTHSPSWNKLSIGIEMLGDYSKESFSDGRGLLVRQNTVAAIASLSAVLGIDPETMKLHKEDKLTTHNCPGKNVIKSEVINEVLNLMLQRHPGDHPEIDGHTDINKPSL